LSLGWEKLRLSSKGKHPIITGGYEKSAAPPLSVKPSLQRFSTNDGRGKLHIRSGFRRKGLA